MTSPELYIQSVADSVLLIRTTMDLRTIRRLIDPIKLVKWHWSIWFGEKIYDSLQGIFEPWIAAWIIAAVVR